MTERDELLIELANMLVADEWDYAYNLVGIAQSKEGNEELQKIAKGLYHKQEGSDI